MTRFLLITLAIGITILLAISSYFFIYRNDDNCSQFSVSAGYMEGETLARECENAGCKVINKKTFSSSSKIKTCNGQTGECNEVSMPLSDSGGYHFDCVPLTNMDKN